MAPYRWMPPPHEVIDMTEETADEVDILAADPHTNATDEDDQLGDAGEERLQDARASSPTPRDVLAIPSNFQALDSTSTDHGFDVRIGDNVELDDGSFLRVLQILLNIVALEVTAKGVLFHRAWTVYDFVEKQANEVVAMVRKGSPSANLTLNSALVDRPISSICMLRDIVLTNTTFPEFSYRQDGQLYDGRRDAKERGVLVCRWKFVEIIDHKNGKVSESALVQLLESEADPRKSCSDIVKKRRWLCRDQVKSGPLKAEATKARAPKRKATSSPFSETAEDEVQILKKRFKTLSIAGPSPRKSFGTLPRNTMQNFAPIRKSASSDSRNVSPPRIDIDLTSEEDPYTWGDICAGAGGMTMGAVKTGQIKVHFTVDKWDKACNSIRRNLRPSAHVLETSIFDFAKKMKHESWMLVDILHLSLPCNYWSQVHTVDGKDDEDNIAALYCVKEMLLKTRPRVVTFEQAPGLIRQKKHRNYWQNFIQQITATAFNVRWKILNCSDSGNAHKRARLFLIASCPGEPLPPFPNLTHGSAPDLLPYPTVQDILDKVPPLRTLEPHMLQCTRKDKQPYNANRPLSQCITKSGGLGDLHPTGKRSFIIQELAMLNGFFPDHLFAPDGKTALREQIGNAVPGMAAKAVVEECVKSMREADRVEKEWKPEVVDLEVD